jgi:alkylhydroperoxidase family enzyme
MSGDPLLRFIRDGEQCLQVIKTERRSIPPLGGRPIGDGYDKTHLLGVKPEVLEHMVSDVNKIPDPKLRDTINFAVKCSRVPRALVEQDYDSLRQHGLRQAEILEIIAMSALAVYANIIADATAMEADLMFDNL